MTAEIEGVSESVPIRMGAATDAPLGFEHREVDAESGEPARGGQPGHPRSDNRDFSSKNVRKNC